MDFDNVFVEDKKISNLSAEEAIQIIKNLENDISERRYDNNDILYDEIRNSLAAEDEADFIDKNGIFDYWEEYQEEPPEYHICQETNPNILSEKCTQIDNLYSFLARKCGEEGNAQVIKFLYAALYDGNLAAIDTMNYIEENTDFARLKKFDNEYLYYFAMCYIGFEISELVNFNIELTDECFGIIQKKLPDGRLLLKIKARRAYIDLIKADVSYDPEANSFRVNDDKSIGKSIRALQISAGKGDFFSRIALAQKQQSEYFETVDSYLHSSNPIKREYQADVIKLIEPALRAGYPPAINLFRRLRATMQEYGIQLNYYRLNTVTANSDTLIDFN